MLLVSILTPVYNVEYYIERCARSLFGQTYPDLEFVFVDDCSPDDSCRLLQQVLEEYPHQKGRTTILHHDCNRGLAAARNTALDHATGDFICVVDSDDWMEPNAIELLVNKQRETSADIVAGNVIMHTLDGEQQFIEKRYSSKEELVLQQFQITWDHVIWRRIIRRSLYENNHIRCIEGCDMAEDRLQMALLAYCADSYVQIDDFVYHYERRNEDSIMAQKEKEKILDRDYQYLRNWLAIRDFFLDKDAVFLREVTNQAMLFAKRFKSSIIRLRSRRWYYRLVKLLDNEEKPNQVLTGWTTEGLRGLYLHSFVLIDANYQIHLAIKSLKKILIPNRQNHV